MDDLRVGPILIPASELRWRFSRSSGAGGQNVNKRSTRAELIFDLAASSSVPSELRARALRRLARKLEGDGIVRVVAEEERTQRANREVAVERMRKLLDHAFRPPATPRKATKPSKGARERRLSEKRMRGEIKQARRPPPRESD
jgi:ribosome-associated protein